MDDDIFELHTEPEGAALDENWSNVPALRENPLCYLGSEVVVARQSALRDRLNISRPILPLIWGATSLDELLSQIENPSSRKVQLLIELGHLSRHSLQRLDRFMVDLAQRLPLSIAVIVTNEEDFDRVGALQAKLDVVFDLRLPNHVLSSLCSCWLKRERDDRYARLEQEVRTTKEFLGNLINASDAAVIAADMNGTILLYNKAASKLLGHAPKKAIGSLNLSSIYASGDQEQVMRKLRSAGWGGQDKLVNEGIELIDVEGVIIPSAQSATIIREQGLEVATINIFRDLREKMSMEQQLSQTEQALLESQKAGVAAELAGMAAHELNQPLTSVLGYADILRARLEGQDSRASKHAERIYEQATRMAEIVRRIANITRHKTKPYSRDTQMIDLSAASSHGDVVRQKKNIESIIRLDTIDP